jgi:hypothetical protein
LFKARAAAPMPPRRAISRGAELLPSRRVREAYLGELELDDAAVSAEAD